MKEMYDAVATKRIPIENIDLIYQHNTLEERHRALLTIVPIVGDENADKTDATVSMTGNWVEEQTQALESLRRAVDATIYGTA